MKLILVLLILSMSLTSASLQEDFTEKSKIYTLNISEERCSSFEYKILSIYFKDFVFKIETNESFYLIIKNKECLLYFEVVEIAKPDITIIVETNSKFIPKEIKANTLRGEIAKAIIKKLL